MRIINYFIQFFTNHQSPLQVVVCIGPRGIRQICAHAHMLGSLPAGINKTPENTEISGVLRLL